MTAGVKPVTLIFLALLLLAPAVPPSREASAQPSPTCPIPQAGPGTFTVFWITDTQFLSEYNSSLFAKTTQWIADNYAACDGRMVVHTGDIIQNTSFVGGAHCSVNDDNGSRWAKDPEWLNANQSMGVLLKANIPYTWNAGNHDGCHALGGANLGNATDDGWTGWDYAAFNPSVLQKASKNWANATWVGSDDQGMDTAVSFTLGNQTFLVVNTRFNGVAELPWVSGLLSQYPSASVIMATHAYIDACGATDSTNSSCESYYWGPPLSDFTTGLTALMDEHPNVMLTLNGHYLNGININDTGYHERSADGRWSLMFNGQGTECIYTYCAGAASVTTLTFNLADKQLYVNTFGLVGAPTMSTNPLLRYELSLAWPTMPGTTVTCDHSTIVKDTSIECTATVTGNSPTGTVSWSQRDTGGVFFSSGTCTLFLGQCQVTVTGISLGPVTLNATYAGDPYNLPSSGTAVVTVKPATTTTVSTSSSTASSSTTFKSSSSTGGSGNAGVPEFPFQLGLVALVTVAIVAVYTLVRRSARAHIFGAHQPVDY